MEGNLLKKDTFTNEYRFSKDLVKAVIEMQTVYVANSSNLQLDNMFTSAQSDKIRDTFTKEWHQLDERVRRFTHRDEGLDYSDQQCQLCVAQLIEEYGSESEEEFLLVSSRIAYVAACFLRNNDQSDAIRLAVDSVYEINDTYYPSLISEDGPLIKKIDDPKYRFTYDLVTTLIEKRGINLRDLKLPYADNCLFTADHKIKVKELFSKERSVLDELLNSNTCKDREFDYSDENLLRCFDKIMKSFGSKQNTEEDFVLLCARIAYASAWFLRKNSQSNAKDLAVDHIHKMVKKTTHFNNNCDQDYYRFACDLIKAIEEIRNNLHLDNSFFMVAHRNKIENFLSREEHNLDELVQKFVSKDETLEFNDEQFSLCMYQIIDVYKTANKSKEEMVQVCTRIAYVAACFLRRNNMSNALEIALNHMLEIVKDIKRLPLSEDEKVLIMRTRDDHYRFSYDLVKSVLEIKSVSISDVELPDLDNYLFTDTHRNGIEKLLSKELSRLDIEVESLINKCGLLDYSDSSFLRCMNEIIKTYYNDKMTEEGLIYVGAIIAYLSAYFFKENFKSNATFLAVNRIYEIMKDLDGCSNTKEQIFIVKSQDDHYLFAYYLTKTVFEVKGIPVHPIDLPDPDNLLFPETLQKTVKDLVSKEWLQLDEMVEKLTNKVRHFDYSDSKFLQCMNQILQDYQSDQKTEEFVYVCARIAYTEAVFLIKNDRSNASFLAVNRMYEMSKDAFHNNVEEAYVKEETWHFTYDLVRAAFRKVNNSSKMQLSDPGDSPLTIKHRRCIQSFLSKEWPYLHQLVRKFTRTCAGTAFCDGNFLHCTHQIIKDNGFEQKSEEGLLLVSARIAYVATCFLRKNRNSNATDLAFDRIQQMRKNFCLFRNSTEANSCLETNAYLQANCSLEANFFVVDVRDDKYRFAFDLVGAVMEWKGMPRPDAELPNPNNILFTPQHKDKIKKHFKKISEKLKQLLERQTNIDGEFDYSDGNFQRCMDRIFKDYKHEQVNENGFVRLCANMAYPAPHFVRHNDASNASTLAVSRIHEMVRNTVYFNKDLEVDDKYRFAYDLVKAVVEMQGTSIPHAKLPKPVNCLFTSTHKQEIKKLFSRERRRQLDDVMKTIISENKSPDYSDKSFIECMDQIIKEYKPEPYTEEGFVSLCARIAYVASGYRKKMKNSNAANLAVNQIHEMVRDVFLKGTLSESSW